MLVLSARPDYWPAKQCAHIYISELKSTEGSTAPCDPPPTQPPTPDPCLVCVCVFLSVCLSHYNSYIVPSVKQKQGTMQKQVVHLGTHAQRGLQ